MIRTSARGSRLRAIERLAWLAGRSRHMRTQLVTSCALGIAGLLAGTANSQAQQVTCRTAHFSETVRAKLLSVKDYCLNIVQRDGEPYAVLKADVARVHDDGVVVYFEKPDGTKTDRYFIPTNPNLKVDVNGEETAVHDLSIGQHLTAYVKVSAPVVAFAQPAGATAAPPQEIQAVATVPAPPKAETRQAQAPRQPKTAR
jgi:hypothetical protein